MFNFSWNQWLSSVEKLTGSNKRRQVRRARTAQIELLEDRALLTAHLPVAVDDAYMVAENESLNATTVVINDTDADSDSVDQATLQSTTSHGALTLHPDGTFVYTPDTDFVGIDSFTYFAVDSLNAETSAIPAVVRINVGSAVDSPPTANSTVVTTAQDTPFIGELTGMDPDGTTLTFLPGTSSSVNGTAVIQADGKFTFTPTSGFTGVGSFTFRVSDGTSTSANATVTVQIHGDGNTAPSGTNTTFSVPGGAVFLGTLSATDIDGDPLQFANGTGPAHGSLTIDPDGGFSYLPDVGFVGQDSFTFTVNDGTTNSAPATVTLNVGNSKPFALPVNLNTAQNTPINSILPAIDLNGDPISFRLGNTPPTGGTVVINSNGSFVFTPTAGFTGNASFSFIANDGIDDSDAGPVTIQVGIITNVAPEAISGSTTTPAGTPVSSFLSATDANGDTLTFAAVPNGPAHGSVVINPNGSYTYTPDSGFNGVDTFSFTARDGSLTSLPGQITVTIGTGNTAPVVLPVTVTTAESTPLTGILTGTDANGNTLVFSAGAAVATNGTVVIGANGTYTFTPTAGFVGNASFSYKANDGTVDSPQAIVTVIVTAAENESPVVVNGGGTTAFETAFAGSVSTLGTDPENNALTYGVVTQPAHGILALSPDGTFTYTPAAGFSGADSFTFKANDGTSDSNVGTFNLTVSAEPEVVTLNLVANGTIATKASAIVPLDRNASLANVGPNDNFANTTIQASFTDGSDSRRDKLLVTKIRGSELKATSKKITLNGSLIATISGGKRGAPLTITFNGSATQATVTSVLQRIGAGTTKSSVSSNRTVQVRVTSANVDAADTINLTKV